MRRVSCVIGGSWKNVYDGVITLNPNDLEQSQSDLFLTIYENRTSHLLTTRSLKLIYLKVKNKKSNQ